MHPLLERLRFLAISASNLDEFFMVRVSGLIEQVEAGETEPSMDGLTPSELLARITEATAQLTRDQEECWRALRDKLAAEGILVVDRPALSPADVARLETYFTDRIFATVTPMAIDPEHPFPFIPNLELSLALEVVRQATSDPSPPLCVCRESLRGSFGSTIAPKALPVSPAWRT